jgi:hypothetical protein
LESSVERSPIPNTFNRSAAEVQEKDLPDLEEGEISNPSSPNTFDSNASRQPRAIPRSIPRIKYSRYDDPRYSYRPRYDKEEKQEKQESRESRPNSLDRSPEKSAPKMWIHLSRQQQHFLASKREKDPQ